MSLSNLVSSPDDVGAKMRALASDGVMQDAAPRDIQALFAAIVRLYADKADNEGYFPIVPDGSITATDAMIVSSALLKVVNIAVFELGLWQSWAGGSPEAAQ
jgi:hypothetical protein